MKKIIVNSENILLFVILSSLTLLICLDSTHIKLPLFIFVVAIISISLLLISTYIKNKYFYLIFFVFLTGLFIFSNLPGRDRISDFSYPLMCAVYIFFILFDFEFDLLHKIKIPRLNFQNILLSIFALLFFFSVFVVNVQDFFTYNGFCKILIFILGAIVSGYYLPRKLIINHHHLLLLFKVIFYVGAISSLYGMITYFIIINPEYGGFRAAISFFKHINSPAFLYAFSIPCGLYLFFYKWREMVDIEKVIIPLFLILMIINVLLTFSRAGILALVVNLSVFSFLYSKKLFFLLISLGLISASFIFSNFIVVKGTSSAISRWALIYAAVDLLKSSQQGFYFGFGAISALNEFKATMDFLGIMQDINFPHNFIIFYILQFGILSLLPLMAYIFSTLFIAIKKMLLRNLHYLDYEIMCLSISIVLACFVQGLLEDMILFPEYFIYHLFLFYWGLIVYLSKKAIN